MRPDRQARAAADEVDEQRVLDTLDRVRSLRKYGPERELQLAAQSAGVSLECVRALDTARRAEART